MLKVKKVLNNIIAYVEDDLEYDFYWTRENVTYKIEHGCRSVLFPSFTEPGDEWKVYLFNELLELESASIVVE